MWPGSGSASRSSSSSPTPPSGWSPRASSPTPTRRGPRSCPGAMLVAVGMQLLHLFTVYYLIGKIDSAQRAVRRARRRRARSSCGLFLLGRVIVGGAVLNAVLGAVGEPVGAAPPVSDGRHRSRSVIGPPRIRRGAAARPPRSPRRAPHAELAGTMWRRWRLQRVERHVELRGDLGVRQPAREEARAPPAPARCSGSTSPVDRMGRRRADGPVRLRPGGAGRASARTRTATAAPAMASRPASRNRRTCSSGSASATTSAMRAAGGPPISVEVERARPTTVPARAATGGSPAPSARRPAPCGPRRPNRMPPASSAAAAAIAVRPGRRARSPSELGDAAQIARRRSGASTSTARRAAAIAGGAGACPPRRWRASSFRPALGVPSGEVQERQSVARIAIGTERRNRCGHASWPRRG